MNNRRHFLTRVAIFLSATVSPNFLRRAESYTPLGIGHFSDMSAERFPHFQSRPVSYLHVTLQDDLWEPRQKTTHEVSLDWITRAHDKNGGLPAFRKNPAQYVPDIAS